MSEAGARPPAAVEGSLSVQLREPERRAERREAEPRSHQFARLLRGTVVDERDQPLAATLILGDSRGGVASEAGTDANGDYELALPESAGNGLLIVRAPGFATRYLALAEHARRDDAEADSATGQRVSRLSIRMRHGRDLLLSLVWADGESCPGAVVTAFVETPSGELARVWKGTLRRETDELGRAALTGLPLEGPLPLEVDPGGLSGWVKSEVRLESAPESLSLVVPRPCSVVVRLTPDAIDTSTLRLIVRPLNPTGSYRVRASRPFDPSTNMAVADDLRLDEEYHLSLFSPGQEPHVIAERYRPRAGGHELVLPIDPFATSAPVATEKILVRYRLLRPDGLAATLRDLRRAGIGLTELRASYTDAGGRKSMVSLAPSFDHEDEALVGSVALVGEAPFTVAASAGEQELGAFDGVGADATLDWMLPLAASGRVSVTIRGLLEGAELPLLRGSFQHVDGEDVQTAVPAADGRLEVDLQPSAYAYRVETAEGLLAWGRFDCREGEQLIVEFERAGAIVGRVDIPSSSSRPAVFASPAMSSTMSAVAPRPVSVSETGDFEIGGLQPGAYLVSALAASASEGSLRIDVDSRRLDVESGSATPVYLEPDGSDSAPLALELEGAAQALVEVACTEGGAVFHGPVPQRCTLRLPLGSYRVRAHPFIRTEQSHGPDTSRLETREVWLSNPGSETHLVLTFAESGSH